jgi:glucosamine-6-phosphate deaminase
MNSFNAECRQREKIPTDIFADASEACRGLAERIAHLLRERAAAGRHLVLGLATGSTPVPLYRHLVRLHRGHGLSFANAITFNLDEYYGLPRDHPESYWRFMHDQLFDHVDIPPGQIFIPDGRVPRGEVFEWCQAYEARIEQVGGIDLQIIGIGRSGHIGFNEPGSSRDSRTRLVTLDARTRHDAARDFVGEANVPRHALTTGVKTILSAREIVLLAWGEAKAHVAALAIEQPPSDSMPASFVQLHPNARCLLDSAAASELTRVQRPWLVGRVDWSPGLIRRAVTWLAFEVKRPILKLLDEHYGENGMADLLTEQGPAYNLNIRVFNETQHTITGWPGGKPNADDVHRPERAHPFPKTVVVFAPEPSAEMHGMAGTLARLVEQGHAVTVAYLTSGYLAVSDEDAAPAAELVTEFSREEPDPNSPHASAGATGSAQPSPDQLRRLKSRLRRAEARAALRTLRVSPDKARFLDLPFYENGRYRQFHITEADSAKVAKLLQELQPHQIFATGADTDPSQVAGVGFQVIQGAFARVSESAWWRDCRVWLYESAEKTWAAHQIDMAVPLSPDQLAQKVSAIHHVRSQHDQHPQGRPTEQEGSFSAGHSARELARTYDRLGLAEYEAIEPFRRFEPGAGEPRRASLD